MKALVLEKTKQLRLRDIDMPTEPGPDDVKIAMRNVGICGSDVHFYEHGAIGPFVVRQPLVLGHEGAGEVVAVGQNVSGLKPGDRVCMEPGIPDWTSRASRQGLYNLDPKVRFWACSAGAWLLGAGGRASRQPDFQTARQCELRGRRVCGASGCRHAGGDKGPHHARRHCRRPRQRDDRTCHGAQRARRRLRRSHHHRRAAGETRHSRPLSGLIPVNSAKEDAVARVREITGQWGADIVFEASGHLRAYDHLFDFACPGGAVVLVGMPEKPVAYDVVAAQAKELRVEHVFRYANIYDRAVALLGSGKIDVKPLISRTFPFEKSIEAFEFAAERRPEVIKTMIVFN